MSNWEKDLKFGTERCKECVGILKRIYKDYKFNYSEAGGESDIKLSTDLIVELPDKTECWAVKIRRAGYNSFGDVTIEYMNGTGEKGDWFRFKGGIVHKYIYGHCNNDNKLIKKFFVININKMMEIPIDEFDDNKNYLHGSSTFKTISLKKLEIWGAIENFYHIKS